MVCMRRHKNGATWLPVKSKSNLKQSDGRRVQFLHRMAFHSNRPRQLDFGTY